MLQRLALISHVWPGYTLFNIWDLSYRRWVYLRDAADAWAREAKRG